MPGSHIVSFRERYEREIKIVVISIIIVTIGIFLGIAIHKFITRDGDDGSNDDEVTEKTVEAKFTTVETTIAHVPTKSTSIATTTESEATTTTSTLRTTLEPVDLCSERFGKQWWCKRTMASGTTLRCPGKTTILVDDMTMVDIGVNCENGSIESTQNVTLEMLGEGSNCSTVLVKEQESECEAYTITPRGRCSMFQLIQGNDRCWTSFINATKTTHEMMKFRRVQPHSKSKVRIYYYKGESSFSLFDERTITKGIVFNISQSAHVIQWRFQLTNKRIALCYK